VEGSSIGSEGYTLMMAGKFLLTFGILLGFPLQQLWSLRRERRAHRGRGAPGQTKLRQKVLR
jgi:hypothetical protein